MPLPTIILWVYIVLLLVGGTMGLIKAGSKVSLITSAIFAVLLALCALGIIRPFYFAKIFVGLLLVVFGIRFAKGRKFMPSGLMLILSRAHARGAALRVSAFCRCRGIRPPDLAASWVDSAVVAPGQSSRLGGPNRLGKDDPGSANAPGQRALSRPVVVLQPRRVAARTVAARWPGSAVAGWGVKSDTRFVLKIAPVWARAFVLLPKAFSCAGCRTNPNAGRHRRRSVR